MRRFLARKRFVLPFLFIVASCCMADSCDSNPANAKEQRAQQGIQQQYNQSQPIPQFKWSQYRETLIEIEAAQANTVQTTTFAFNQGVIAPVWSCPSIGFPVASTANLSNPQQLLAQDNGHGTLMDGVVGQMDPNGVYSGDSTGTYVVCVAPDGTNSIHYWEGYTDTVSGPAVWSDATHSVQLSGPSTVHVKTK